MPESIDCLHYMGGEMKQDWIATHDLRWLAEGYMSGIDPKFIGKQPMVERFRRTLQQKFQRIEYKQVGNEVLPFVQVEWRNIPVVKA